MTYSEYREKLRNIKEIYVEAYNEHGATAAVTKNLRLLMKIHRNRFPEYSNKHSHELLTGREYKPYV